jgi:hypothetical protein
MKTLFNLSLATSLSLKLMVLYGPYTAGKKSVKSCCHWFSLHGQKIKADWVTQENNQSLHRQHTAQPDSIDSTSRRNLNISCTICTYQEQPLQVSIGKK